jgi:hypothetical protein
MVLTINTKPIVPPIPKMKDKREVDVRYMVVPPYASVHVFWNDKINEIVYELRKIG